MFMSKMRRAAAWIMGIMAAAFVGWLVFDGITAMQGGGTGINPIVGRAAGRDIRYNEWSVHLQNQLAIEVQGRSRTDEEQRVATERAWESLVNAKLMEAELDRLGVVATDAEVRQAFFTQPPQEMLSHPAFQTDGAFDIQKYRNFFTDPAADQAQLLQIENYYRTLIPRVKLQRLLESSIFVSEGEAWRFHRDTNERARVRFVSFRPRELVPDSSVSVSEAEVRDFYDENSEDFVRPASARANMVSVSLRPSAGDSLGARDRAARIAERIRAGSDFASVAEDESDDPNSAANGGFMGKRPAGVFNPVLVAALDGVEAGEVTEPVETNLGLHILQLDERSADSLALRQVFVAFESSGATEDSVFDLLDDIEDIALRSSLAAATDSLGVELQTDVSLIDGMDFVPGAGPLGVATEWALRQETEIGELSESFENPSGFHLLELLGRTEESQIPFAEAYAEIEQELIAEKKKERARLVAEDLLAAIEGGASLEEAAEERGWIASETELFRRGDFVPGLGQGSEAIGYAFGAAPGSIGGPLDAGSDIVVLEVLEREETTRERFEEVKDAVLAQLRVERSQQYVQKWMAALREGGLVEDHRERLLVEAPVPAF